MSVDSGAPDLNGPKQIGRLPFVLVAFAVVALLGGLLYLKHSRQDSPAAVPKQLDHVEVSLVCANTPDSERNQPPTSSRLDETPFFDWEEGRKIGATISVNNTGSEPIRLLGFSPEWDGPLAASSPVTIEFAAVESFDTACDGWELATTALSKQARTDIAPGEQGYFKFAFTLGRCTGIGWNSDGTQFGTNSDQVTARIERDGTDYEVPAGPWPQLMFRFRTNQCPWR